MHAEEVERRGRHGEGEDPPELVPEASVPRRIVIGVELLGGRDPRPQVGNGIGQLGELEEAREDDEPVALERRPDIGLLHSTTLARRLR